jgi:gamma-glutamylcyclotransferase (GGCT)/AIG2-like uncharacterized protein YtfP
MLNRVFVYGTLMQGMSNHQVVAPYLLAATPAQMKGILFDLAYGYPAVTDGDGLVIGELLELSEVTAALAKLDSLEEYHGQNCPENLYDRVIREVVDHKGNKTPAYVYLWSKPEQVYSVGKRILNGDWKI